MHSPRTLGGFTNIGYLRSFSCENKSCGARGLPGGIGLVGHVGRLMSPMPPNNFKEQEQGTMDSSIDRLICEPPLLYPMFFPRQENTHIIDQWVCFQFFRNT